MVCVHGKGEKLEIIRSLTPQWRQLGLLMDFDKVRSQKLSTMPVGGPGCLLSRSVQAMVERSRPHLG